jgi:UDP-2,4-diacetamido-2,4,6-trideoxy-beta-L-altropyranose hydrolase
MMTICFRTDASVRLGAGHLMRCLALADELLARGARTWFLCSSLPESLREVVSTHGHQLVLVGENEEAHEPLNVRRDALHTAHWIVSGPGHVDVFVVDHYGLDQEWESRIRPHTRALMAIDDLPDRPHESDLVLDQNLTAEEGAAAWMSAESSCALLGGPQYALLRPEFAGARSRAQVRKGPLRRILVSFGGSDTTNVVHVVVEALRRFAPLRVDLVLGESRSPSEDLSADAAGGVEWSVHRQLDAARLAELMLAADLAIGGGGVMTWERCCLGLPTLGISLAENQRRVLHNGHRKQFLVDLGDAGVVTAGQIVEVLQGLARQPDRRAAMSEAAFRETDGRGAGRVADAVVVLPETRRATVLRLEELCLRPTNAEDVYLYYSWTNDAEVRRQSFASTPIPLEDHCEWFTRKLADPRVRLYVLERRGLPLGQIRFEVVEHGARINYTVDAACRGQGMGTQLLRRGSAQLFRDMEEVEYVFGLVKNDNLPSLRSFHAAGFSESKADGEHRDGSTTFTMRRATS